MNIMKIMKKALRSQEGQVALLLILVIVVAGVVAVSVAGRTVTGLKTQQLEREGLIALKGAESGIENVLSGGELSGRDLSYGTTYQAERMVEGADGFVTGDVIQPGDVVQINIDGGTATAVGLCWNGVGGRSALKVSSYSSDEKVVYAAYDSVSSRSPGFSVPSASNFVCPDGFGDKVGLNVSLVAPKTLYLRASVLYFPTEIAIVPVGGSLPEQQIKIVSLGKYETTNVQRKVELVKENDKLPSVFDNVLFTRGNISQ